MEFLDYEHSERASQMAEAKSATCFQHKLHSVVLKKDYVLGMGDYFLLEALLVATHLHPLGVFLVHYP